MQIKQSLKLDHVAAAVCEDVKRHFKGRLPREWKSIVCVAVYPDMLWEPDLFHSAGHRAYRKCLDRNSDLTLEILRYARQCCESYLPQNCKKKAALVRAILLNFWNGNAVEKDGMYRMLTQDEIRDYSKAYARGKAPKYKFVPVNKLHDKQIADWINTGYSLDVTTADVKEARQALSTPPKQGKKSR